MDDPASLLVGSSPYMRALRRECRLVAPEGFTVVIQGESGTGKHLVAREIERHCRLINPEKRMVRISAAQLGDELLDSTLFGHAKWAFTDAKTQQPGLLKSADGNLLFWDDGQDTTPKGQARLLDILEDKPLRPLGDVREFTIHTRVLFGVQLPLRELVSTGTLRRDLAARLNVYTIRLVPLRQHIEDLSLIVAYLLERIAARRGKPLPDIDPRTTQRLLQYVWPDNIREVETVMEQALFRACCDDDARPVIRPDHLGTGFETCPRRQTTRINVSRAEVLEALRSTRGHVGRAAPKLGMGRRTLERRIRSFDLDLRAVRGVG